ncbi:hypothetical protein PSTT_11626 [Puccinia striiformis]|uniref:Uncharacterized protein n=1 Tax=Puccinia striiformis TaxID=27350 RepID=A0A2S4UZM5_9BASI|nr:hypothetical protein PSTT_11626 [Puccinia striiformis]
MHKSVHDGHSGKTHVRKDHQSTVAMTGADRTTHKIEKHKDGFHCPTDMCKETFPNPGSLRSHVMTCTPETVPAANKFNALSRNPPTVVRFVNQIQYPHSESCIQDFGGIGGNEPACWARRTPLSSSKIPTRFQDYGFLHRYLRTGAVLEGPRLRGQTLHKGANLKYFPVVQYGDSSPAIPLDKGPGIAPHKEPAGSSVIHTLVWYSSSPRGVQGSDSDRANLTDEPTCGAWGVAACN